MFKTYAHPQQSLLGKAASLLVGRGSLTESLLSSVLPTDSMFHLLSFDSMPFFASPQTLGRARGLLHGPHP